MSEFRFLNLFMSKCLFVCCCFLDVPMDSLGFTKSVLVFSFTRVNWPVRSAEPPSLFTIKVENV